MIYIFSERFVAKYKHFYIVDTLYYPFSIFLFSHSVFLNLAEIADFTVLPAVYVTLRNAIQGYIESASVLSGYLPYLKYTLG